MMGKGEGGGGGGGERGRPKQKGGIQAGSQVKRPIPYSRFSAAAVTEALGLPPSEKGQYSNRQYLNHLLWAEYCLFSNPNDLVRHPPSLTPGSSNSKNALSKILYSLQQLPISTSGEKVFFITSGGNRIWRTSEQKAFISDGIHTLTIQIGQGMDSYISSEDEGEGGEEYSGKKKRKEVFRFRAFSKKPRELSLEEDEEEFWLV